ncbi:MAG: circadian clock protein KaiB [Chloroflexaceae bacterium]|jgi:circadian clock protein KaiB|nr:circadian clock protein KaiB [Chloroflexaceae bacterium]
MTESLSPAFDPDMSLSELARTHVAPFQLRLFVCGQTANSLHAIHNLNLLLEERLAGQYMLDIIDVLQQPALAEEERILATPTLIRVAPPPVRRIIGDLSNRERVLLGLGLHHQLPDESTFRP